jgi:hypothetical protein
MGRYICTPWPVGLTWDTDNHAVPTSRDVTSKGSEVLAAFRPNKNLFEHTTYTPVIKNLSYFVTLF